MKRIQKDLEDWIKPFTTIIGERVKVDESLRKSNPLKYFIQLTIPPQFEAYAIILHSFWIKPEESTDKLSEDNCKRVTWKDFLLRNGKDFILEEILKNLRDFHNQFTYTTNEFYYPSEGELDEAHIYPIIELANEFYGNQDIESFYIFLATKDWSENRIYEGKLKELPMLLSNDKLCFTPSLIYPKDKSWLVNSDFDLPFSTIGGEKRLIEALVRNNADEIYRVKY